MGGLYEHLVLDVTDLVVAERAEQRVDEMRPRVRLAELRALRQRQVLLDGLEHLPDFVGCLDLGRQPRDPPLACRGRELCAHPPA